MPERDAALDHALVLALLRDQQPDLAALELRFTVAGWSNQLWRLGDDLAVRLPNTDGASAPILTEQRWLPKIGDRLPLPVPIPVRIGVPSRLFGRPWTITRWVPGEPADGRPVTDPGSALALADFLRALHRTAPADAPTARPRGGPLAALAGPFEQVITEVDDQDLAHHLRSVWAEAVTASPWSAPAVWVHADLQPANVVTVDGALAGVVDFECLAAGDPAVDLAAVWLILPTGGAGAFFSRYGPVDDATLRRARGWAILISLSLIGIGRAWERGLPGGQPHWGRAGRLALDRLLAP